MEATECAAVINKIQHVANRKAVRGGHTDPTGMIVNAKRDEAIERLSTRRRQQESSSSSMAGAPEGVFLGRQETRETWNHARVLCLRRGKVRTKRLDLQYLEYPMIEVGCTLETQERSKLQKSSLPVFSFRTVSTAAE